MIAPISITALTSVSALGSSQKHIWQKNRNRTVRSIYKKLKNMAKQKPTTQPNGLLDMLLGPTPQKKTKKKI